MAKAEEIKLGGEIALVGFGILEPIELTVVRKIVGNYVRKMNNAAGYKSLRLVLQQHKRGKTFMHEVYGQALFAEGSFGSTVSDWNLYKALARVLEKILAEVQHSKKQK